MSTLLTQQIDENLKRVYGDSAAAAVPDKFLDLIERLRMQETSGGKDAGDDDEMSGARP